MAERKDREVVHLRLGQRDADIVYWKDSIPYNSFTWYVKEILAAEKNRYVAAIPVPARTGLVYRKVDVRLVFTEKAEIQMIRSIPKGKRNTEIKRIIRKHLRLCYAAKSTAETVKENPTEKAVSIEEPSIRPEEVAAKPEVTETRFQVENVTGEEDEEISDEYRDMLKGLYS